MKQIKQIWNRHSMLFIMQCAVLVLMAFNLKQPIPAHRLGYITCGILLVLVFCVFARRIRAGFIDSKQNEERKRIVILNLFFMVAAVGLLFSFDLVHVRSIYVDGFRILSNVLVLYAIILTLYLIVRRVDLAVLIATSIAFVFNVAVYEVYVFRGIPIAPWDIYAVGTAADVATNYDIFFDEYMIYAWIVVMAIQQLSLVFKQRRARKEIIPVIAAVALLVVAYHSVVFPHLYGYLWDVNEAYIEEGLVSGFIAHIPYAQYKKPKNYSSETTQEILRNYKVVASIPDKTKAKNIIVIMNESFADLECLGTPMAYDYMPFIHGLSENVIKADLVVPVYGGGTSNTEFEMLTGNTCAFNLQSPYETVIRGKTDSIVRELQAQGFYCEAYHPGEPESWKRDKVYDWMGFEAFDTNREVEPSEQDMIGRFAGDAFDYQQVIQHFENRDKSKPYFLFNVTIQNHGAYDMEREGLAITDEAKAYHEYPDVEQYLSLVQESDEQLQQLLSYFEKESEPTMICFFGDHLPALQEDFMQEQQEENLNSHKKYQTPLIIWANYDIEEKNLGQVSANYLMPILLKEAGLELSDFDKMLETLHQKYPVISTSGIDTSDGQFYNETELITDDLMKAYEMVEYYRLKDYKE